jgi:NTP pyrophosphatase (non-canonical NTP hydrolase)
VNTPESDPQVAASTGSNTSPRDTAAGMDLGAFQAAIERTYGDRDRARGVAVTVAWLAEEIGELAQAVRKGTYEQQVHEFGDVVAWVATLANQQGVDLADAVRRYVDGCPRCGTSPCTCP